MLKSVVKSGYELAREYKSMQRPNITHFDLKMFPCFGPKPRSLVEISGNSNTGKSLLLQQIVAKCVLPTYFGGKYAEVIFIDLGHHFNIKHYLEIGKRLITESRENYILKEDETCLEQSLQSVKMIECFTPTEFELALVAIENILWDNTNISLLVIDNLEAFYWLDFESHPIRMQTHYANFIKKLQTICTNHNIVCMYTVNTNYIETKSNITTGKAQEETSLCVEHRLRLRHLRNDKRTLNENEIEIHNDGIHFI